MDKGTELNIYEIVISKGYLFRLLSKYPEYRGPDNRNKAWCKAISDYLMKQGVFIDSMTGKDLLFLFHENAITPFEEVKGMLEAIESEIPEMR